MKTILLSICLLSICLIGFATPFTTVKGTKHLNEIKPINEWTGKTRDETHQQAGPENGLIVDQATWNELWKKWKPHEATPEIDFSKDFVLVQQVRSPNQVMVSNLELKDGKLTFQTASSRMGGPGFGFALLQISREGIEKVKDVALPEFDQGQEKESGFKTISIETTGGIAGLMKVEKVTADGKIIVESTKDGSRLGERQLNAEQLATMIEHVDGVDWAAVPKSAGDGEGISDGMQHVIKMETAAGKKFEFEYGSIAANKDDSLRKLMQIIAGQKVR